MYANDSSFWKYKVYADTRGGYSWRIADVGVSPSRKLKLISREIIFEVFEPM